MDAKNLTQADRSKRKMRQTLHSEKFGVKPSGEEPHFFRTHKVATEPVSFGPKPEIAAPTLTETIAEYATEVGKVLLEEGTALVKQAEGPAREIAAAGIQKVITRGKKLLASARLARPVKKTKKPARKKRKTATPKSRRAKTR